MYLMLWISLSKIECNGEGNLYDCADDDADLKN